MDYETIEDFNLVICQKLEFLYFGKFNNYLDFSRYMIRETKPHLRCYYETIFGTQSQKPYFDIEFYTDESGKIPKDGSFVLPKEEADQSVICLLDCIEKELRSLTNFTNESKSPLSLNSSHILVFTSHLENKRSYHVVVEGFSFSNYKENKEFHDRLMKSMPDKWKNIVDHSMYKSLQQFRIVGNTKFNSSRYKSLSQSLTRNFLGGNGWIPKVTPESEDHELVLLMEASLVTQTISCQMLICKPEEVNYNEKYKNVSLTGEGFNPLTPEEIKEALALCYKYANMEFGDPSFPYNYLRTVENNGVSSLILLKRLRPSRCAICERPHENENPFLIINGEERAVYLDCRRNAENKKLFVGKLGLKENKDEKPPSPTVLSNSGIPMVNIQPPTPSGGFDLQKFIEFGQNISKPKETKPSPKSNESKYLPVDLSFLNKSTGGYGKRTY
jgi:hypothetical protein